MVRIKKVLPPGASRDRRKGYQTSVSNDFLGSSKSVRGQSARACKDTQINARRPIGSPRTQIALGLIAALTEAVILAAAKPAALTAGTLGSRVGTLASAARFARTAVAAKAAGDAVCAAEAWAISARTVAAGTIPARTVTTGARIAVEAWTGIAAASTEARTVRAAAWAAVAVEARTAVATTETRAVTTTGAAIAVAAGTVTARA